MKISLVLFGGLLASLSFSCGPSSSGEGQSLSLEAATENAIKSSNARVAETYTGKLDQLLTLEMASEALGFPATEASKDYGTAMENPAFHSLTYTWDRGRTRPIQIAGRTIDAPVPDYVGISGLKKIGQEDFEFQHRQLTEEEKVEAQKQFEDAVSKQAKEKGLGEDGTNMAKGLGEGMMGELIREKIAGVGDLAVWMPDQKTLAVWEDGIMFNVQVNTAGELSDLKNIAADLAEKILKNL